MAQVFPVLILAIVWESSYLEKLRKGKRVLRRHNPDGVVFWTKRRVRVWTISIIVISVTEISLIALVLSEFVRDSIATRLIVLTGLACILGSILTRAIADIVSATREG
jgi:hypothetical protein